MRISLFPLILTLAIPFAWADGQEDLYKQAGWAQQREHFSEALTTAQQQYRSKLPEQVYTSLAAKAEQRFNPQAMDQRALQQLRQSLPDAGAALAFFNSELGQKIVRAEVLATSREQLKQNAAGLPKMEASAERRQLIDRLTNAMPVEEVAADASLALASVATDSASQVLGQLSAIPGLSDVLGSVSPQNMLEGQRQKIIEQIRPEIGNTMLYVYRNLSDQDLADYAGFAESSDGQQYYQAVQAMVRAALSES